MNAKEAKQASDQATRAIAKRKQEAQQVKDTARSRERARALREDYPAFKRKALAEIRKVTARGQREAVVHFSESALAEKLTQELKADDYRVNRQHREGYENYGDFNAPCNVWETSDWLEISW